PLAHNSQMDADGLFLQSSFSGHALAHPLCPFSNLFPPPSSSQPLRTPVKQAHRVPSRSAVSVRHINNNIATPAFPSALSPSVRRVGGTKRKSTAQASTTPLRPHTLTPLRTATSSNAHPFMAWMPQTVHLRKQTASLMKLKITDFDGSDFGDSGCEMEDDDAEALFRGSVQLKGKMSAGQLLLGRAKGDHEASINAVLARPVSNEILNRTYASPAATSSPKKTLATAIAFPSAVTTLDRTRTTSTSSHSSAGGSPAPRRRVTGSVNSNRYLPRLSQPSDLFFGPTIPSPPLEPAPIIKPMKLNPPVKTRHSYAGPSNIWNTMQSPPKASSPFSSPVPLPYEWALFFGSGPREPSFMFNLTKGTPSPRPKMANRLSLPMNLSDEQDVNMVEDLRPPNRLTVMPRASTSVNSILSDVEDGLITPGFAWDHNSSWLGNIFVRNADDRHDFESELGNDGYVDVDAFIVRTLAAPPKTSQASPKKAPGTPVKSRKLGLSARPWQSAVANKVGLADWNTNTKKGNVPRKSLPAAFPPLNGKPAKPLLDSLTDSEGEEDSPSGRRDNSGAFSNGSDPASMNATPTRTKGKEWHLSVPRLSAASPSKNTHKASPARTASGSSNSSTITLNSPTTKSQRHLPIAEKYMRYSTANTSPTKLSMFVNSEEQAGRFAGDFVEVGELGSGEFGKVIKVQLKSNAQELFAIKKSKRFEGPKHRRRLREEVEILQHLKRAAASSCEFGGHPNVLAYIDSWEEDEALYIQTELCESGNLAGFLWEYGRVFPRLDEARVWKIIVDLSNGTRFIHDSGVIHLDLKPSNVFVTGEGRFKIGDFGMASLWPRPLNQTSGFEREGDKLYLAPEVLQGKYGKVADVFSLGMTILETATNIVVPDQGEAWHRLRTEDFSQVYLEDTPELFSLIHRMMRTEPSQRVSMKDVCDHPVVSRARAIMERTYLAAIREGTSTFAASPLSSVSPGFLEEILERNTGDGSRMDVGR
ncbi:kinase-like protein, partial [Pluteus cervinus]